MTPPNVTSDIYTETLAVFDHRAHPVEPLTTVEVAEALDRKRRTVYNRLETLADRGELMTKSAGANARVWWRPLEKIPPDASSQPASREVLERLPVPATLHDPSDGSIVDANRQFSEMLGYEREELLALDFDEIHLDEAPYSSDKAGEYLQAAINDGPQTFEWRDRTKTGESLPVEVNLRSTTLDDKRWVLAMVRDLSEQKGGLRQAHQHEVIMELGQFALESGVDDLDELFAKTCRLLSETLDTDYCKILELVPGGEAVLLREGVGWRDGLVGSASIPTGKDSQAGYTIQTEEPVIVDDLREEERFSGPELLTSHDVVSGISVIIGSLDAPWGVLGTHTTDRREFTQHDATFVQNIANILASAIQSTEAKRDLAAERRLRDRIAETSPVGITVVNTEGKLTFANERAEEILGRRRESLEQLTHNDDRWDLTDENGEPFREGEAPFDRVMATGETIYNEEINVLRQDGRRVWLTLNGSPLTSNDDDTISGAIFALTDITEERQIEAELEDIFGRVTDAFTALDRKFRFTHVNERAEELLQHPKGELLGEVIWEVFPEAADIEEVRNSFEKAVFEQEPSSFEIFYPPLGFWAEANLYPSETGVSVYFRDVTDRKEREAKLERTLDMLRQTERIADVGGWEIDPETNEVFWSDHVFELLGLSNRESPSLNEFIAMCHEADRGTVEAAFDQALKAGDPFEVEARLETGRGEERWFRLQGAPEVSNEDVTALRGAIQDVTEQLERVQSIERFQTFLDHSTDLFSVLSADGTVAYQSPSSEWILGYDPGTLIGEEVFEYVHPDDRERTRRGFEKATADPAAADVIEFRFTHADGSWRWLEARGNNQLDNPAIEGFVVNSRDITEQKEYERYLEDVKDQLEAANEAGAVGTFEWDIPADRIVTGRFLANVFGVAPDRAREGVPLDHLTTSIHEADRDRVLAAIEEAVENCGDYEEEYRVWDADGNLRWVIARGHVESDADGNPTTFPGALTDITELKEQQRELESLDRFNETIRSICLGAAEAASRAAIEQRVCERLIDSDGYVCASIGEAVEGGTLHIRSVVDGTGGFLDDFSRVHEGDAPMAGLGRMAHEAGEMQVISDLTESAPTWGEVALEWGIHSVAAIPLVHEDIPYGVLTICADRPYAFDDPEGPILCELGEIVAHTIAAIERKAVMMSDEVVEFELLITNIFEDHDVPRPHEGRITFERVVPMDEGTFREFGTVSPNGVEMLRTLPDAISDIEGMRLLDDPTNGSGELRFELRLSEPPFIDKLTSHGARFVRATIEDGDCLIVVQVPHASDIHAVNQELRNQFSRVSIMAKRHVDRRDDRLAQIETLLTEGMSERQRTILEAAYYSGYFDWPRDTSGQEIAEAFGISPSTASQHLRLAQRSLFKTIYD